MARKKETTRSVTFRMPQSHYDLIEEVASARGVDVSAILNQAVTDALPNLGMWLAQYRLLRTIPGGAARVTLADTLGGANTDAVLALAELLKPNPRACPMELSRLAGQVIAQHRTLGGYSLSEAELIRWATFFRGLLDALQSADQRLAKPTGSQSEEDDDGEETQA